jgi:predicted DCC family thiol-disulfide oxidoreductase YuxK
MKNINGLQGSNFVMVRFQDEKDIVIFDGFCQFCSASVNFILRRDPEGHFAFAASQSPTGNMILNKLDLLNLAGHSILLLSGGKVYRKSSAALRIARKLKGIWPLFYGFIILPRPVRDFVYDLVARNRYRLFGKREECYVPQPGVRDRFI